MKCPHCSVDIHPKSNTYRVGDDIDGNWAIKSNECSACNKLFLELISATSIAPQQFGGYHIHEEKSRQIVYPARMSRPEPSVMVPSKYRSDFIEACLIVGISPKASAALSRRCLQALLRDNADIKKGSLEREIQQVIDSNQLPSYISQAIDSIRNIGNFAAHPLKCTATAGRDRE
ncbi:DUF4145 domain-containing protein, partial [Aliivibrio sp. 1S128]|uniref:DUF4145 domain-containing protein n=1 Tax=Aliivibrio sp. 1S128 TaxID=1840085 RepID=UPI00080E8838